jgi:hypothetical protein
LYAAVAAALRVDLFARIGLVSFFGHKNERAYKRLMGMRRQGVEKPRAAWVFSRPRLKKSCAPTPLRIVCGAEKNQCADSKRCGV